MWLFVLLKFFWCESFLKSLLNYLQYCFWFMFWFFSSWGMWNLSSLTRAQTHTLCIGRWRLNHWPPGKSQMWLFKCSLILVSNTSLWTWGKEAFQPCSDMFNSQFSGRREKIPFFSVPRFLQFRETGAEPGGGPVLVCVRIKRGDKLCFLADGVDP